MKPTAELTDDFGSADAETGFGHDQWKGSPVVSASKFPVLARFGIVVGALVTTAIAAVIVLPMVLPASMTIARAEAAVGEFLGLDVTINGAHSIRLFPSVRLVAAEIVAVPAGSIEALTISNLEIEASTLSLISGSLDISALSITKPSIRLSSKMGDSDIAIDVTEVNRTWGGWRDFEIGTLNVSEGEATIVSSGMTDDITITDITLMNVPPAPNEAADGIAIDGTANANGQNIALHIAASDPQLLVSGNRWPLTGIVTSNLMSLGFDGSLAMRESLVGNGNVQFGSNDVAGMNEWLGTRLPNRQSSVLSIITPFELTANTLEMKGIKISVGATEANGMIKVTGMASGESVIEMTINAEMLDFGEQPMALFAQAGTMTSLPQIPGTARVNWREAMWAEHILGPGNVIASKKMGSGALNVKLEKVLALNGVLRGDMTLDRSEGMRAMHFDGTAIGVSFEDLIAPSDALAAPLVSGKASIDLSLFSVGGNADQMFEALSGTARLQVQDGALGVPVLAQGLNQDSDSAISFSSLNGTFNIAQGIATSEDLLLRAEDLSLVGRGNVDMADWTIELDIGQLKTGEGERSLKQYRLSGPARAVEFEAIN